MRLFPALLLVWFSFTWLIPVEQSGLAQESEANRQPNAESVDFFEQAIRPILIESCLDCHAVDSEASGGLLLDSQDGWKAGGDSGMAIVPGDAEASLLWQAINYQRPELQMPPDGKLPASVIADFKRWIDSGAVDPRRGVAAVASQTGLSVERAAEHWAYRPLPLATPQPPHPIANAGATTIDDFVNARLAAEDLPSAGPAGKAELVRRLTFDLTGLPPTPDQLARFLNDPSEDAYSRLVDSLLASPRFGEVQARRWMDVARYADSITLRGFVLPEAWRYRDYLINAFNADRPFDELVREQVAGDLLDSADLTRRQHQLRATAFLVLGNTNLEQQDKTQLEMDVIDEQLEVIGRAFLGQTIGCARCHDHKFDPIPTADYYALAGILRSSKSLEHENVSKWIEQPLPLPAQQEQVYSQYQQKLADLDQQIQGIKQQLAAVEKRNPKSYLVADLPGLVVDSTQARLVGEWTASTFVKPYVGEGYLHAPSARLGAEGERVDNAVHTATFEPENLPPGEYEVRLAYTPSSNRASNVQVHVFSADGEAVRTINQRQTPDEDALWVSLGKHRFEKDGQAYVLVSNKGANGVVIVDAVQFLAAAEKVASQEPDERSEAGKRKLQQALKPLEAERKRLQQLTERPRYLTLIESGQPQDIPVHIRGNVHNLGEVVPRGFLTAIGPQVAVPSESSGRLELANWLASPENPLTARVYANRVWMWIMGRGIVATPNNFGTTGATPSHPELLDWLARELIDHGWSTKHLIRQIVHSDAYRRAWVEPADVHLAADPDNRLWWRGHARRLSVEALRDAMLMVSGELDLTVGGSLIRPGTRADYDYQHASTRRSLYHPVFRNSLPELYEAFDFADTSVSIAQRPRSTVATQALVLMNHPWVVARARAASQRLRDEFQLQAGWTDVRLNAMVREFYRRSFSRDPTTAELQVAVGYLLEAQGKQEQAERLEQLVHSLLASLDFRYLD